MKNNLRTFTLNANVANNEFQVVFKQPLLIAPNSKVEFKMARIVWTGAADYRQRSYAIQTDLPITNFFAKQNTDVGNRSEAVEDRILAYVPPAQNDDVSGDDPAGGIPAIALRVYEPYQDITHPLDNNVISLNSMNFKLLSGNTLVPFTDILEATIQFTIYEC